MTRGLDHSAKSKSKKQKAKSKKHWFKPPLQIIFNAKGHKGKWKGSQI